jgi:hypothetical protein
MDSISLISLGLNILILIVSISGFVKIMKNDLNHLAEDVKEIKHNINNISRKITKVDKVQVTMQAVCAERHKNRRIK